VLGGKADRNGFFYVNDAKTGKLVNAFPFVKKITWATGIDLKTGRPNFVPENRPGDPTAGADGKKGKSVFSRPSFLGGKNQMPMAYSPGDPAVLRAGQRVGHGDLERAHHLQEGRGLPGRGLHHQDAGRRPDRRDARHRPEDRQDRLGSAQQRAAVGRRADHRAATWCSGARPRASCRPPTPRPARCCGSSRPAPASWPPDHLGRWGEQYVAVASGWGGAVPLWGGDVAKKVDYLEQGGSLWVFKLMK
jgi:alcohol dehydrogenase (cytochrome c)